MGKDKTKILIAMFAFAAALTAVYFLVIQNERNDEPEAHPPSKQNTIPKTMPVNDSSTKPEPQAQANIDEEFISEQLAEQIEWVAQAYEQQARYPVYSVVVNDPELAMKPLPFDQARVEMKTFDEQGNLLPTTIAASVDKLSYVAGEIITIQLQVNEAEAFIDIFARVNVLANGGVSLLPSDLSMLPFSAGQTEFRTSIDSTQISLDSASEELLVRIEVQVGDEQYVTTVPFFLSTASAKLENLGQSKQNEDHLEIPLQYDVYESGYYFVSAYLDDAKTGRPLLSLQTEGRMTKGSDELIFKAHHQALKDAGSDGPYKLRITSSFRGAEPDEGDDIQTAVSQSSYDIPDFSFDGYADIPFSDPIVDERLKALQQLSGND